MPPLFEFRLTDLERVVPWGKPGDPNLHWFGLSDGSYWINAGQSRLFEYSADAEALGFPRFCDYQVVRVYEDLLEIAPYVLEEVPQELHSIIQFDANRSWDSFWHAWRDLPQELVADDEHGDLIDSGAMWLGQRVLDSLYLSPPANIRMWSDSKNVHIVWDNRARKVEGRPAWSASAGTYSLSRDNFVDELFSFHERFMSEMEERVQRVVSGELQESVRIDLGAFAQEHRVRSRPLDRGPLLRGCGTDWDAVAKAVARLEELCGET